MMSKNCGIFTPAHHYLSSTQLYRSRSRVKKVDTASDEVELSKGLQNFADAPASFTSDISLRFCHFMTQGNLNRNQNRNTLLISRGNCFSPGAPCKN